MLIAAASHRAGTAVALIVIGGMLMTFGLLLGCAAFSPMRSDLARFSGGCGRSRRDAVALERSCSSSDFSLANAGRPIS